MTPQEPGLKVQFMADDDHESSARWERIERFITGDLAPQEEEDLWADAFEDPELFADLVEARPIEQIVRERETVQRTQAELDRQARREAASKQKELESEVETLRVSLDRSRKRSTWLAWALALFLLMAIAVIVVTSL